MTTQLADMEVLKEIPGYKAIMKAVLKTQIQLLVEQLCNHTGEESIILTASVNDGSLSHLGSDLGKGFLDGREEIKSQFLGYCLKGHHKKKTQETEQPYQRSNISQPSPRTPLQQQTQKRSRIHPVSLSKAPQTHQYPASDNSFVPPAAKRQFRERNRSQEQVSDIALQGAQSVQQSPSVSPIVKQESQDNENDQTGRNVDSNFTSQPLPASLHISHTQTSGDPGYSDTSHSEDTANTDSAIGTGTSIKIEPVTEAELDLEITGVEMGEGAAANWGQNVSGPVDYGSSDAGDSSFDQPGNQSGYGINFSVSVHESIGYEISTRNTSDQTVSDMTGDSYKMMNSIQILLFGTVCVFLSLTAEVSPTKQADDQETEKTPPQNSSTKEMPLPNNFAEYDSNGDGLIHYEEFTHAVLSLHPLSDMDNLRPLFQTWDTNGDEKIDMEEFNASPLAEAEQTGKARRCRLRCYLRCFLFLCAITCRITS